MTWPINLWRCIVLRLAALYSSITCYARWTSWGRFCLPLFPCMQLFRAFQMCQHVNYNKKLYFALGTHMSNYLKPTLDIIKLITGLPPTWLLPNLINCAAIPNCMKDIFLITSTSKATCWLTYFPPKKARCTGENVPYFSPEEKFHLVRNVKAPNNAANIFFVFSRMLQEAQGSKFTFFTLF